MWHSWHFQVGIKQPGSLTPPIHAEIPTVTARTSVSSAKSFSVFSI